MCSTAYGTKYSTAQPTKLGLVSFSAWLALVGFMLGRDAPLKPQGPKID